MMRDEKKSFIWGLFLIIIGFIFLGNNLDWFHISFDTLWPLLMILGGGLFWIGWILNRKDYGLLMPGTILIVYGLMFQYNTIYGWYYMEELWPGFLLGPGLGFYMMYLLGNRERGLLIPGTILTALSILFFMGSHTFRYFWPLLLIGVGVYLIFKKQQKEKTSKTEEDVVEVEVEKKSK
jgi:hypothetical protein